MYEPTIAYQNISEHNGLKRPFGIWPFCCAAFSSLRFIPLPRLNAPLVAWNVGESTIQQGFLLHYRVLLFRQIHLSLQLLLDNTGNVCFYIVLVLLLLCYYTIDEGDTRDR